MHHTLACGCATCGCACAEHSPDRLESACNAHSGAKAYNWAPVRDSVVEAKSTTSSLPHPGRLLH